MMLTPNSQQPPPTATSSHFKGRDRLEFDLRQKLLDGLIDYDTPLGTEVDFSQRYGICRNTVRKVLQKLTDEGLLYKRQGLGTFAIPPEERTPYARIRLKFLVMLPNYSGKDGIPNSFDTYDNLFLSGVSDYAFQHAGLVMPRIIGDSPSCLHEQFRNLKFDGIIWERPPESQYDTICELQRLHVPQVTISRQLQGLPNLYFDFRQGFHDVVQFLVNIGHQDVVFLDLAHPEPIFQQRHHVFEAEIRRFLGPHLTPSVYTNPFKKSTDGIMERIYADHPQLTALFCSSTLISDVWNSLEKKMIRIPYDLTIVTLNENDAQMNVEREISALREPRRALGWRAAELIHRQLYGNSCSHETEYVRGELVIRKTCASPLRRLD